MTRGTRVARVSLGTDGGTIGEAGAIEHVFTADGEIFGYRVVWDSKPAAAPFVCAARVADLERYRFVESRKRTEAAA